MNAVPAEAWRLLGIRVPQGDEVAARLLSPQESDRVHCAVDSAKRRHFLIRLAEGEDGLDDTGSRGLAVATRELQVADQPSARYVDITCLEAAGHSAFDVIGVELLERLALANERPAQAVGRVIAKWRRFWGLIPGTILSREEVLGLFGEIRFLGDWLLPRLGAREAVARWRGPFGARHDFEWHGASVEAKTTSSHRARIHRISSLDQLAPPEGGLLYLYSLRVSEEAGAYSTLPSVVETCRSRLSDEPDALSLLEIALQQAGYYPAHSAEYAKLGLRLVDEKLFQVAGRFPRLVASSFVGGLPTGVEQVAYEVNLGAFDELCVASEPSAMPAIS